MIPTIADIERAIANPSDPALNKHARCAARAFKQYEGPLSDVRVSLKTIKRASTQVILTVTAKIGNQEVYWARDLELKE